MDAATVSKAHKSFGRREALCGVSLRVPSSGIMGLLGPNGAGKSTLIRMFAGVLRPDSGSVEVAGQAPSDFRIRAKIGVCWFS